MRTRRKGTVRRPEKAERPIYLDDDRALAADFHAHRKDPGFASKEAVKIESRPTGMQIVSFRLPTEELRLVLRTARATGESLSEFVRDALALRLGKRFTTSPIEWSLGTPDRSGNFNLTVYGQTGGRTSNVGVRHKESQNLTVN